MKKSHTKVSMQIFNKSVYILLSRMFENVGKTQEAQLQNVQGTPEHSAGGLFATIKEIVLTIKIYTFIINTWRC